MAIAAIRQGAPSSVSAKPQIAFADVTLQLGGKTIIEKLSLGVRPGEFLCIVGASGCGKTTALRLAAGLYQPTSGKVNFDGQPMLQPRRDLDLALEPIDAHTRRELRREHLHDDGPPEGGLLGDEDSRHAAASKLALEGIGTAKRGLEALAKFR